MFLIEKIANTEATLKQKSRYIHDGKQAWVSVPCMVFENRNARLGMDETGRMTYGHVFFVAPLETDPSLPAQLEVGNRTFDVLDVKYYHDLSGENLGYRLKVAGS